jgi:hypothetical protein
MVDKLSSLSPEQLQVIEKQKLLWKQRHNMTDEDYATFLSHPAHLKMSLRTDEMRKYKVIAEAIKSSYCNAGVKVGQKFVFRVMPSKLLVEESDCPFCIKALGPMGQIMFGIWDRLLENSDPNESWWTGFQCLDPGIERGGLGNVQFRVYVVREP